jgi:hypothetical protein
MSGFLIGLLTSMITWHILFHRIVPSLEFFPAIYKKKTDENPSGYKYRIKFRNTGRREVLDVELFAKLRIEGLSPCEPQLWRAIYIPIDDTRIPRIVSHRGNAKRIAIQLRVTDLDDFGKACLPPDIRAKCYSRTVTLEDLMNVGRNATLEIIGFGYDPFSGARKVFESQVYSATDINEENSNW